MPRTTKRIKSHASRASSVSSGHEFREMMISFREENNMTDNLHAVGIMSGSPPISTETKLHHENMALYMFIGLVIAFLFISSIIISVELYRNGICMKNMKRRAGSENERTKLDQEEPSDAEFDDL